MEYQYYNTYTSKLPHYGVSILQYIYPLNCLIMEHQYYNTYTSQTASLWSINITIHIPHKLPHYGVSILQYIYLINYLIMEYQYYYSYIP